MTARPGKWPAAAGFTLIELILMLLVAGILLAMVMNVFLVGIRDAKRPEIEFQAALLAEGMADQIGARLYDEQSNLFKPPYNGTEAWSTVFGIDCGEGPCAETAGDKATFDDVDDFLDYSETIDGYEVTVTAIGYVDDNLANNALDTVVTGPTDFKRVTITVSHPDLDPQNFVTLYATECGR